MKFCFLRWVALSLGYFVLNECILDLAKWPLERGVHASGVAFRRGSTVLCTV